jgi:glycosyltransferase involved in cell wall biosynthesis
VRHRALHITHAIPVYAPAWQFGGPVLSVSRLCEALAQAGHHVKVLTTNAGLPQLSQKELGHPVDRNGVSVTYFPVEQQNGAIQSRVLEKSLSESLKGSDLLHISTIWQPLGIPIQKEAFRLKIPVIQTLRGALGPYSLTRGWWKKLPYYYLKERPWLQKAAGLHVTTVQEQSELAKLNLQAPCHLIANPIALENLEMNPDKGQEWRQKHNINRDTPLFLICGRQHHKKGLDLLPEVFRELKNLDWKLILVGHDDDGSGQQFINGLKHLNLESRLIQLPSQPNRELASIYNAADLLLLPSRHENFGNVVTEAMACGCAVAISDRTGVGGDLLRAAPASFGAVLPRQEKYWTHWLSLWLKQPERAGSDCAQWARQNYGSAAIAEQAIAMYRKIIEANHS